MIFAGMNKTEAFFFHSNNDKNDMHFVEMERDCDECVFYVRVCCDDEWEWKFYDNGCNYDLVKHVVMEDMLVCDDMDELIRALDNDFEEIFDDIVVWDCEDTCDCETGCNCCGCK